MQNAPRGHSAILSTFIKLPFVFKILVLSLFEWPLKTGFTVLEKYDRFLLQIDHTIIETKLLHMFFTGVKHAKEEDLRDMGDVQSG